MILIVQVLVNFRLGNRFSECVRLNCGEPSFVTRQTIIPFIDFGEILTQHDKFHHEASRTSRQTLEISISKIQLHWRSCRILVLSVQVLISKHDGLIRYWNYETVQGLMSMRDVIICLLVTGVGEL